MSILPNYKTQIINNLKTSIEFMNSYEPPGDDFENKKYMINNFFQDFSPQTCDIEKINMFIIFLSKMAINGSELIITHPLFLEKEVLHFLISVINLKSLYIGTRIDAIYILSLLLISNSINNVLSIDDFENFMNNPVLNVINEILSLILPMSNDEEHKISQASKILFFFSVLSSKSPKTSCKTLKYLQIDFLLMLLSNEYEVNPIQNIIIFLFKICFSFSFSDNTLTNNEELEILTESCNKLIEKLSNNDLKTSFINDILVILSLILRNKNIMFSSFSPSIIDAIINCINNGSFEQKEHALILIREVINRSDTLFLTELIQRKIILSLIELHGIDLELDKVIYDLILVLLDSISNNPNLISEVQSQIDKNIMYTFNTIISNYEELNSKDSDTLMTLYLIHEKFAELLT